MSHEENTKYEEWAWDTFQAYLKESDWDKINTLFMEFQEEGMSGLEVKFLEQMDNEQLAEYRRWHKQNEDYSGTE